ncbi:hypothetical protein JXA63_04570 [Candidatus Woesebacteria bacterium]|nr:hypothetical protein [Candidatus Woesebacteria bacterium]
MLSRDLFYIFNWWIWLFVFGIVSLPITYKFFGKFVGAGYGLSKTVGLAFFGYAVFFLSIIQILPFKRNTLLIFFLIYAGFNYSLFKKQSSLVKDLRKKFRSVIVTEILFVFGLVFWSIIRGYQPDINGLEKFMDYGFINSILRSEYLPPADMWFAGGNINYYWFGHFITALITKLSNIPSSIAYNIMIATILGLSLSSVFTISATLLKFVDKKLSFRTVFAAGLLSAVLMNFGGNFHTPFYLLKDGIDNYWYSDATRFIGYNPDREDKTIHEFPLYSYVVSDLHAHLLDLPFVLLYLSLLIFYIRRKERKLVSKNLIPLGFVAGIMFITNTWDFGNYLLTTGFALLIFEFQKQGIKIRTVTYPALRSIVIALSGIVFALPFILNFVSIAEGVKLVNSRSYIWQLLILWGFPLILTATLTVILSKNFKSIKKIKFSDLFVFCLHVASWILIVLPEIFYVKDIYIASHHRANTMFKLTYQAFVMFYLTSGYIAVRAINLAKKSFGKLTIALFFGLVFWTILGYPSIAIKAYYNKLETYHGLDGTTWLSLRRPELGNVVNWFNKNVEGQPVILESPGDSYTEYNVISSYTGLPTVSGWFVHEWLWRGTADIPQARVADIEQIYSTTSPDIARHLLQKYDVKFVIVGEFEREKFTALSEEKFTQLGETVFTSGTTSVYEIN